MQILKVGGRYPIEGSFPREGAEFAFNAGELALRMFLPGPRGSEVKAVCKGEARLALAVEGPAAFLVYRFGEMPWSDAPFNVHLVSEERRRTTLASSDTGEPRNMLQIHFVDSRSLILKAIRVVGLPRVFTDEFEEALQSQVAAGWCGAAAYDTSLAETYQRYSSDALARRAVAHARFPREAGRG